MKPPSFAQEFSFPLLAEHPVCLEHVNSPLFSWFALEPRQALQNIEGRGV
jgi:hypothetical protein